MFPSFPLRANLARSKSYPKQKYRPFVLMGGTLCNVIAFIILFFALIPGRLQYSYYDTSIRRVCVGGIDKRQINKEHLEEFPIILPPMELQSEFVFLLHQVKKLKSETQKAIDNTQMLLDSLIQKYFE